MANGLQALTTASSGRMLLDPIKAIAASGRSPATGLLGDEGEEAPERGVEAREVDAPLTGDAAGVSNGVSGSADRASECSLGRG
jgi:hypothetical protein